RPPRRLERAADPLLRPCGSCRMRLAARARPAARPGARGRPGLRDRAVQGRAERRPSARADLDSAPAFAVGVRTSTTRESLVARARGGGAGIDSALGTGASCARRDPLLPRLRI